MRGPRDVEMNRREDAWNGVRSRKFEGGWHYLSKVLRSREGGG